MKTSKTQKYTKSDFERFMITGKTPPGIHNGSPKLTNHNTDAEYRIERGVPVPEYHGISRFPLLEMEVGDSFVVQLNDRKALRNAVTRLHKRNQTFKFITRTVKGRGRAGKQIRIWRVESHR